MIAQRVFAPSSVAGHADAVGYAARQAAGQPLDGGSRAWMEARFGQSFADVRVHRDAHARALTGAMDALAVTHGADIYFAGDAYAPGTRRGRAILSHELAHVAQQRHAAADTPEAALEAEASRASRTADAGRDVQIRHGSARRWSPLTSNQKDEIALGGGAAGGALLGIGVAALKGGSLLAGGLIGGLAGFAIGAAARFIPMLFQRRTPESVAETDELIRRRFKNYIQGAPAGPLHNAAVHVVQSGAEICERQLCRFPNIPCDPQQLGGWTDFGAIGPSGEPAPVASAADEPVCHHERLDHATPARPVIYYVREPGTLIHEALHAYSSPSYQFALGSFVDEGTTEYFARELRAELNLGGPESNPDETDAVSQLIGLVGEAPVANAYFGGHVHELCQQVNAQLGPCGLEAWVTSQSGNSGLQPDQIMNARHRDYCETLHGETQPVHSCDLMMGLTPGKAAGAAGGAGGTAGTTGTTSTTGSTGATGGDAGRKP